MKKFMLIATLAFLTGVFVFSRAKTSDSTYTKIFNSYEIKIVNFDFQTEQEEMQISETIIPPQSDFLYENFFDFTGDGIEEFLTIRDIGDYYLMLEIWDYDNTKTIIWSKEIFIVSEAEQFLFAHEFEDRLYLVYTYTSSSDWGYFRTDYFYSLTNGHIEETEFFTVWDEVIYDENLGDFAVDRERYFYINDIAVTESEYRNALGEFGLEFEFINHRYEWENGSVREWYTSEINLNNPIYYLKELWNERNNP